MKLTLANLSNVVETKYGNFSFAEDTSQECIHIWVESAGYPEITILDGIHIVIKGKPLE